MSVELERPDLVSLPVFVLSFRKAS